MRTADPSIDDKFSLYARLGYVAFDHRVIHGYARVFMRKDLP